MQRIWQVAEIFNHGEPQILEVFKNTQPPQLYWVLFLIDNLHVVVDSTKRILTKERPYRQQTGSSLGLTPFMALKKVKESQQNTVTFSEESVMNEKIDKLASLIGNPPSQVTQNRQLRPFKSRVYQGKGRLLTIFSGGNRTKMMETEVMPGMNKTLEDAIPLDTTGTIKAIGEVKMDPMACVEVEIDMTEVDI